MIAAFAAGCMDNENFIQFKDYFKEGGELPKGELGELQNIVSMIPIILDLETPDPALKDKVAKRLIELKDEIKSKIREERRKTFATRITRSLTFTSSGKITQEKIPVKTEITDTGSKRYPDTFHTSAKIDVPEEIKRNAEKELLTSKIESSQPDSLFEQNLKEKQNNFKPGSSDKPGSGFIGWIALMASIIMFCIVGYFTYSSVSSLNKKVNELESKTVSLRSELATSTNFVNKLISVFVFLNIKNITVIDLNVSDRGGNVSARVLLAFNEKEGLIQFKNVKTLQPNQGYQLWLVGKGQAYSMGVYSPAGRDYMRITTFPYIPREQVQSIMVTIESSSGSPTPSAQSYLTGNF
jgi:hypothetical protein